VEEAKEQQKTARELPLPVSSEGKFEFRFVQAFIELLRRQASSVRRQ
jgi:hypothetical protein